MIDSEEKQALDWFRFAERMQTVALMVREVGQVPDGMQEEYDDLLAMVERVKTDAFDTVLTRYRVVGR